MAKRHLYHILFSQVWYGRESSVGEEFALHADICNLGYGFQATDYMRFFQSPGTEGKHMRPNRLSIIYRVLVMSTPLPVGWGSTYCFTAVGVRVCFGVPVGVTPITKAPPAQIFFGWHVFCSTGH